MGTGIEAVGEAVAGGAFARAVEPGHGERADAAHGACLNCGTALHGAYCHGCGQKGHVHRTLGAFMHDLLHGVFHFEGKIWRTLPDLAIRPGKLTRDYIEGKRARYVSPLALFLFCVFLMFAVLGWTSIVPTGVKVDTDDARASLVQLNREIAGQERALAEATQRRGAAIAAGRPTAAIDREIAAITEKLEENRTGRAVIAGATGMADGVKLDDIRIATGRAWLDEPLKAAAANPKLLFYKMKASAYKFAWAIIPLSVPFVALLFLHRRRFGLYDHAVFVTYSLCAMSLLLIVGSVLGALGLPADWLVLLVPLHFFLQLRGTYGLGALGATWRTIALIVIAAAVMTLFAILLLLLGIF